MNKMIVALAVVLTSASMLFAQPLADHVPADTLVYAGWAGTTNLGSDYAQTHLKALLDSCDLQKFFTDFLPAVANKVSQKNAEAGQAMGTASSLLKRFAQHPSAFYFAGVDMSNPNQPMPKIGLICDAGADAPAMAADLQRAIDRIGPTPVPVKMLTKGTMVWLVIGPQTVEAADQANLAADPQFKSAFAAVQKNPVASIYVNPRGIIDLVNRLAQKEPDGEKVARVIDALGLKGAAALVWTGGFDGKDWATQAFLAAPAPRTGILSALDATPVSDDILKLIPSTATMVCASTFDPAKVVPAVRNAAAKINPNAPDKIDHGLDMFRTMTGLDLQKDVLEPLGEQWGFFNDPTLTGSSSFGMVVVNKLRDPAKADTSLNQLAVSVGNIATSFLHKNGMVLSVRETTYGGVKIHYFGTPLIRPAWAVKDGVLYAGLMPQSVAAAVANPAQPGKTIMDNPQFTALIHRLHTGAATSISYIDLPRTAPLMYPTWMMLSGYSGLGDLFDIPSPAMILPPLGAMLKQLEPAAAVSWVDDGGWHMAGLSPFPGATALATDTTATVAVPALLVSILLPSLNRARDTANRVKCASNERQIGQAILLYSNDHKGKYPPDLGALIKEEDITPEVFTCPTSNNSVPPNIKTAKRDAQANWVNANSSYIYIGAGMNNTVGGETVMLYEKADNHDHDGMNLLFGDGHVEWDSMPAAEEMIKKSATDAGAHGGGL